MVAMLIVVEGDTKLIDESAVDDELEDEEDVLDVDVVIELEDKL